MAREKGPYSVAFPVDFTSKGDTTRDAFRKHMDEITRIYGILTGLDDDTMDADSVSAMLQRHIDSTNPHPNYKPSVSWANVTNKPSLGEISGNLEASRVIGKLTGANIDYDKVNGLSAFVDGKMPTSTGNGDGITALSKATNGYAKFNNGLIIQWGTGSVASSSSGLTHPDLSGGSTSYQTATITFSTSFSSMCYDVILTAYPSNASVFNMSSAYSALLVQPPTNQNFTVGIVPPNVSAATVHYLAIGV